MENFFCVVIDEGLTTSCITSKNLPEFSICVIPNKTVVKSGIAFNYISSKNYMKIFSWYGLIIQHILFNYAIIR